MTARGADYEHRQMRAHLMDDLNDAERERDRERELADALAAALDHFVAEHPCQLGLSPILNDYQQDALEALRQWREARARL